MFGIHRQSRVAIAIAVSASTLLGACAVPATGPAAASIDPPQGERVMTLSASGVQIYACELDAQQRLGWVFRSPQATLFDPSGQVAVHHGAGPSWQAEDGSRIVGRVLAQRPSDTPASIPQLLLETHSTATGGVLSTVRYVQRVQTVGGMAPGAPCSKQGELGQSPYLASYVFYR
jgi:hypothetical protein